VELNSFDSCGDRQAKGDESLSQRATVELPLRQIFDEVSK